MIGLRASLAHLLSERVIAGMTRVWIFCVVFLLGTTVRAQDAIDLITLSGRSGFPSDFTDNTSETASESGALVNLKIPVVLNKKSIWYSDFTYTYYGVDYSLELPSGETQPIRLHGFVCQTGLVQKLSGVNSLQILVVPRYMSDMINPGSESWQLGAVGLYEHRFGDNLKMRFGALYNSEIAGPLFVPLVGIDWNISARWSLTGLFPIYGKLNYKINDKFTTGLSHFGLFTSYNLTNPEYSDTYMERSSIDLSGFLQMNLVGNIFMEARVGYALARKYEQYRNGSLVGFRLSIIKFGDDRGEPLNQQFRDGLFGNLRVIYRLPLG